VGSSLGHLDPGTLLSYSGGLGGQRHTASHALHQEPRPTADSGARPRGRWPPSFQSPVPDGVAKGHTEPSSSAHWLGPLGGAPGRGSPALGPAQRVVRRRPRRRAPHRIGVGVRPRILGAGAPSSSPIRRRAVAAPWSSAGRSTAASGCRPGRQLLARVRYRSSSMWWGGRARDQPHLRSLLLAGGGRGPGTPDPRGRRSIGVVGG
jgi:hypothetical protein